MLGGIIIISSSVLLFSGSNVIVSSYELFYLFQAPHPLYQPSSDLIPCNDPLCKALHLNSNQRCETPEQCDYEVEYADGGSSLGVLVRDVFSMNYTQGLRLTPRLALGYISISTILDRQCSV